MTSLLISLYCIAAQPTLLADPNPNTEAHPGSQAVADCIREFAKADIAFIAGGLIKGKLRSDSLGAFLEYPTDELCVVTLTGAQIKQALSRSISLLPQPNPGFLQLSGVEATYRKDVLPSERLISFTIGGNAPDLAAKYTVAMPLSMGRGGLGYFKIWDKTQITQSFQGQSLESILKDKTFTVTEPRWKLEQK